MSKIGDAFPKDPLASALGLGKNLLPNSSGGPFKSDGSSTSPVDAAPIPTPMAPVTSATAEVIAAQEDLAKQNLMKKSVKNTIYAGDTGGYNPASGGAFSTFKAKG